MSFTDFEDRLSTYTWKYKVTDVSHMMSLDQNFHANPSKFSVSLFSVWSCNILRHLFSPSWIYYHKIFLHRLLIIDMHYCHYVLLHIAFLNNINISDFLAGINFIMKPLLIFCFFSSSLILSI